VERILRMSNTKLYYGEIVARISGKLYSAINITDSNIFLKENDLTNEDMICSISADAGRVFDCLEDLSGEHFVNWNHALDNYIKVLHGAISDGRTPNMADMMSMATTSIDQSRAIRLKEAIDLL